MCALTYGTKGSLVKQASIGLLAQLQKRLSDHGQRLHRAARERDRELEPFTLECLSINPETVLTDLGDTGPDDVLGLVFGSDKEAGYVEDGGRMVLVELAAETV